MEHSTHKSKEQRWVLVSEPILPLEVLEADADTADMASVEGISAPTRRAERLMWRRLAREINGGRPIEVEYSEQGAPKINNFPYKHISVSHCCHRVALVAADERCGVDVECLSRNFERVSKRYISEREWALLRADATADERQMFLAAMWCAKECLYKMQGRSGLDFREDVVVERIDLSRGVVQGRVEGQTSVVMRVERCDCCLIVCSDSQDSLLD